jgi:hypothetical protein
VHASDNYPELFQMLAGYLHQDLVSDYGTAAVALQEAIADTPIADRRSAVTQIDTLLMSHRDERSVATAVKQLCDYHPPGDGLSYREWLLEVRTRIGEAD